jgi:hypothetical protein
MKVNMGKLDRILRLVVAAIIAYLYFSGNLGGAPGTVLIIFAGIFALTSFIGYCPMYKVMGTDTCPKD